MNGTTLQRTLSSVCRVGSRAKAMASLTTITVLLGFASTVNAIDDSSVQALTIELSAPVESVDGTFVVRVAMNRESRKKNDKYIQLWRRLDDGEFQLVTSQPNIVEVAQNLNFGGQYTYQARVLSLVDGEEQVVGISNDQMVEVNLRYPMLSSIVSDF